MSYCNGKDMLTCSRPIHLSCNMNGQLDKPQGLCTMVQNTDLNNRVSPIKLPEISSWKGINWRSCAIGIHKLQKRIYKQTLLGNLAGVHALQRRLLSLRAAKLLAVRSVTQDNSGKATAGIDGVKQLNGEQSLKMSRALKVGTKPLPIRRVSIPIQEKRPLGIPAMRDRALQELVRMALEPQWEAVFEPNSYGFRPGRGAHDAIEAIHSSINKKSKWVLHAEILKFFARISHRKLIEKMSAVTEPAILEQLAMWLKAPIAERGKKRTIPEAGTPLGGVISPLLANVALHGLENDLMQWIRTVRLRDKTGKVKSWQTKQAEAEAELAIIRYADDILVLHPDREVIDQATAIVENFLAGMGLELNREKTEIMHTCNAQNKPLNFLGFSISQFPVGKSGRGSSGLPFKTIVMPSKESIRTHLWKTRQVLRKDRAIEPVVKNLNYLIRGWTTYFRTCASKQVFARCRALVWYQCLRWAKRKHQTRRIDYIRWRYWRRVGNRWRFGYDARGVWTYMVEHIDTATKRHVKIMGKHSPYAGDESYWST